MTQTTTDTPYLGCYSNTDGDERLHYVLLGFLEGAEYELAVKYGWDEFTDRFHYGAREALINTIEPLAHAMGVSYDTGFTDTDARESWVGWLEDATEWIIAKYWDDKRKERSR